MNLHRTPAQGAMIQGAGGAGASASVAMSPRMSAGDTVRGQVLAVENGSASVRLSDGSLLAAQIGEGVQLQEGDLIQLLVTSNSGGKITMQLSHLSGRDAMQTAALVNSQVQIELSTPLSSDSQGAQISALLRQYGVSAGRESIGRVRTLMGAYPQLDIQTAAFLVANGQQVGTEGTTPRLDALVSAMMASRAAGAEASHPLDILLNTLTDADVFSLPTGASAAAPEGATLPGEAANPNAAQGVPVPAEAAGQPLAPQIIITAALGAEAPPVSAQQAADVPLAVDVLPTAETQPASAPPTEPGTAQSTAPPQIAAAPPPQTTATPPSAQGLPGEAAPPPTVPGSPDAVQGAAQEAGQSAAPAAAQSTQSAQEAAAQPQSARAAAQEITQSLSRYLGQSAPQAAATLLAADAMPRAAQVLHVAAHLPPEQAAALIDSFIAQTQLPQDAQAPLLRAADAFRQILAQPMPNDDASFRALVQTVAARLTPGMEPVAAATELNRTVTSLLTNLSSLRAAFTNAAAPEAAVVATQAEARAASLPSITQFTYMQIPVEMYDRREVADLYVMKRARQGGAEKDEYTIAIALETENLGRVEAIIRARDQAVDVTFRMAEGDASDRVRESFSKLEEAISGAGFTLRSAIMARLDKPLTPQTFKQQAQQDEFSRYTLDVLA